MRQVFQEILNFLSELYSEVTYEIKEDYSYLEIPRKKGDAIKISIVLDDELTLGFADWHTHYSIDDGMSIRDFYKDFDSITGLPLTWGLQRVSFFGFTWQTEVDFICNTGSNRYYIQSALNIDTPEKLQQEARPLSHIGDSFKKIIVIKDNPRPWRNNDGILVMGILDFLLDSNSLNL